MRIWRRQACTIVPGETLEYHGHKFTVENVEEMDSDPPHVCTSFRFTGQLADGTPRVWVRDWDTWMEVQLPDDETVFFQSILALEKVSPHLAVQLREVLANHCLVEG